VTRERIGLSFDDGPSRWTAPILELLAAHGARATFFLVGSIVEQHPDLVRRITNEGHEVGNHTWSHPKLARDCDDERIRAELSRTSELLEDILGTPPALFRAPYYDHDERVDAVAAALGLRHADGHVTPADWHPRFTGGLIASFVLRGITPEAIVGLHDGVPRHDAAPGVTRQPTVDAMALILPALAQRNVACVPVSEIIASSGG
jgi:peptidoglycan/xylan/chitin deacetylase (PgdA/CDA1 family)